MLKAVQQYTMRWEDDIPIYEGVTQTYKGEWSKLPWRQIEKKVYKLQKRIYQASCRGDKVAVHRLQKTLMRSWYAKLLSVRRVTQDNQGKKTAGVDGVKSLSPEARLKLVKRLKFTSKSKPTRRVWIEKPGSNEKRPRLYTNNVRPGKASVSTH